MTEALGDTPPAPAEGSRRYPGAQSFTESADDRARFFGRGQEAEALYLRVLSVPLLVHFGRSGLGKTSLLQAGLFPLLRRKPLLPVMVRLQDSRQTLVAAVAQGLREACGHEGLKCVLDEQAAGLWELLSDTAIWRDGMLLTPVLVFDQFEEVFTLRDAAFRHLLAAELGALADGTAPARLAAPAKGTRPVRPPVKLVISLREDFLGGLQEFSQALPALFHERLRLEPMTVDAARAAITGPAALTSDAAGRPFDVPPFRFADDALQAMIGYLQGRAGVIEPFQLQLLCRHAEELARQRGAGRGPQAQTLTLTLADFKGGADFDSVLKTFYHRCIESLPWQQRARARRLCEEGLLDGDGHRLMLDVGQIERDYRVSDDTLRRLDRARLLRREPRLESVFYEISHDRLAGSILAARRFHLPQRWRYVAYGAVLVVASLLYTAVVLQGARERAESLVSFLLGESFLGQVRDAGLSEQLRQVQAQTAATRESTKRSINRGLALRNAGDIARMAGQSVQAVQLYQAALRNFDTTPPPAAASSTAPLVTAAAASGGSTTTAVEAAALAPLREAARSHTRLGEVVSEQGQIDEALAHHRQAAQLWAAIDASGYAAAEDCLGWAASLLHAAYLLQRQGADEQSLAMLRTVMDKAQHVLLGADPVAPTCRSRSSAELRRELRPVPDTDAVALIGQSALLYGILLGRPEDFEGAQRLSAWVRWQQPLSTSARTSVLSASTQQARLLAGSQPQVTAENYRRSLDELDELLRLDASNQQWRRERAAVQLLLAGLLADCARQLPDPCPGVTGRGHAGMLALEALATLRQLVHADAANQDWRRDLAWALQSYADTLTLPGSRRDDEALLAYDQARALLQPMADRGGYEARLTLSRLLVQRAVAVARIGNDLRAVDGYREAISLLDGLLTQRPASTALLGELRDVQQRLAAHLARLGKAPAVAAARVAADKRAADLALTRQALLDRKLAAAQDVVASDGRATLDHLKRQLDAGKPDEVPARAGLAASHWRQFVSQRPADATGYQWLAECSHLLAVAKDKLSDSARLMPAIAAMHASGVARLLDDEPAAQVRQSFLRTELANLLADDGRPGQTLVLFEQAVIDGEELLNPRSANRLRPAQSDDERVRYLLALRDAQLSLGLLRDNQDVGGWEEALRGGLMHVHQALALQPGNALALMGQGELLHYLGDPQMRSKKGEALLPELRLAREAYLKARTALLASADGDERDRRLYAVDQALQRLDSAQPR